MRQTHHITSDLSSWSSREVHQANERVLRMSNKIAQKNIEFLFYILHHHHCSLQTQYFFERQSISQPFIFSAGVELHRVVQLESMIGYKYSNIDSGATPIGSAGRAPDKKLLRRRSSMKSEEEKFRVHCRWQAPENKLDILHPSGGQIQEPKDFRKSKNWRKQRFQEVKVWWNRRLKKSKISRSQRLKKSKFEEVEDWRSFQEVKVWRSQRLKIWSLETQPESATQVESRGLLTWVCPSGTHRLVYRVWPIIEVD
jgi:hypothetical protein